MLLKPAFVYMYFDFKMGLLNILTEDDITSNGYPMFIV